MERQHRRRRRIIRGAAYCVSREPLPTRRLLCRTAERRVPTPCIASPYGGMQTGGARAQPATAARVARQLVRCCILAWSTPLTVLIVVGFSKGK